MARRNEWEAELANARIQSVSADGRVVMRYGNGLTRTVRVGVRAVPSFRRLMAFDRVEEENGVALTVE